MCPMCWMMVPLGVLGAVVVIGVIAAVVVVVARLARSTGQPGETPLAILKRRYAQGEVSSEQFEAAKRQLSEGDDTK